MAPHAAHARGWINVQAARHPVGIGKRWATYRVLRNLEPARKPTHDVESELAVVDLRYRVRDQDVGAAVCGDGEQARVSAG